MCRKNTKTNRKFVKVKRNVMQQVNKAGERYVMQCTPAKVVGYNICAKVIEHSSNVMR